MSSSPKPTPLEPRRLAPEVIQTSWMDCGPASLKCLLGGFGIHADYARLRDLCQIDVDGTSIESLESIGTALGLPLQQLVLPPDYLLEKGSPFLPALVVTRLPNGNQHFAVLWRRSFGRIQEMDPMAGRRWLPVDVVRAKLHIHDHAIDGEDWRIFAESDVFRGPLEARLRDLGLGAAAAERLMASALSDPSWRGIATLDAAARMVAQFVAAGGLSRGKQAERFLHVTLADVEGSAWPPDTVIPEGSWSVREEAPGQLIMRGAVVLCPTHEGLDDSETSDTVEDARARMTPQVLAALSERQVPVWRHLYELFRRDGWPSAATIVVALFFLALGFFFEMFMMRAAFHLNRDLPQVDGRVGGAMALLSLVVLLPVLEGISLSGVLRLGRSLEARFRIALFEKIPALGERYFRTRLASDLAERAHQLHLIRRIPGLVLSLAESLFELVVALGGIYWVDPPSALTAAIFAALIIGGFHIFARGPILERDLRLRNHAGALSRYYLDALLGIVPVRTHGAERAIQRGHDALLIEWTRAARDLRLVTVISRSWQIVLSISLVVGLVYGFVERSSDHRRVLLLAFWALVVIDAVRRVIALGIAYPAHHHAALRAFEPLASAAAAPLAQAASSPDIEARLAVGKGLHVVLDDVTVALGGHDILTDVCVELRPAEHVAVVGRSGSGKSTLLSLLLGSADHTAGRVEINGLPLTPAVLHPLRRTIAWLDPGIQLWNTSVLENLLYGADVEGTSKLGATTFSADLRGVLEALPEGMQTVIGQSGASVSGGEGQRIRLGRALLRRDARLVLLDEPFRGLDRGQRIAMLERCRRLWSDATLVCVTHDVSETLGFPRVLVVEDGRVVEDGSPAELARRPGSSLQQLLAAERHVQHEIWGDPRWRRIEVRDASISERGPTT